MATYQGNPNFSTSFQRRTPHNDFMGMLNRAGNPGGYGIQQTQGNVVQPPRPPNSVQQPGVRSTAPSPQPQTAPGYNFTTPLQGGQGDSAASYVESVYQSVPMLQNLLSLQQQMYDLYAGYDPTQGLQEMLLMANRARPRSGTFNFYGFD